VDSDITLLTTRESRFLSPSFDPLSGNIGVYCVFQAGSRSWVYLSISPKKMERLDGWLACSEEKIFNDDARQFNEHYLPLLHTDLYLNAFLNIHHRHNPVIPSWTLTCSASDFIRIVAEKWDDQAQVLPEAHRSLEKRAIVIGIARRLCSLTLRMDDALPKDATYIITAQRRGLLYHIRDDIPAEQTYASPKYDTVDALTRLEGVELLSMMAHLFAPPGMDIEDSGDHLPYRYEPYERTRPTARFSPPERRLCGSLAYTAFNVRSCAAGKGSVRSPFSLLGEPKAEESVTTFSKEDFAHLANLVDSRNPLRPTLAYLAGKMLELKQLGNDVCLSLFFKTTLQR
jgi:hypothetical protein